ncbi:MAG: TonB-dependent receptor [Muribaculaceae bacterium]|nr:TonB-dependent receptor [Muribaculaceae bacterium]
MIQLNRLHGGSQQGALNIMKRRVATAIAVAAAVALAGTAKRVITAEELQDVQALASDLVSDSIALSNATILDDLDVVAVKGSSNFRIRPLSGTYISSIRAEGLEVHGVKGMSDIVPNFYMPDYGSRITSSIYVRGIGARMDQPAVGLTVDNVGIMNKDAYDIDITDIASMEMLRGPQSSMYGRNTMTGLINIRTLSPRDYEGWKSLVTVGLHSMLKFHLGWYHTFNERCAMSVSGNFYRYGGEFINEYNNKTVDKEVYGGMRVKNYYNPSESVKIANVASFSLLRQGGYPYESVATGKIAYNDTCFYRRFIFTDGLTVTANLPENMTLMSVTTAQYIHDNMTLDQDFLPEPYFTLTQRKREVSLTQDIMLKGTELGGNYSWLAGLYGFYRHLHMDAPVTFKEAGIQNLIVDHRNSSNPHYPIVWDTDVLPLNSVFRMPSGGVAAYHESRFDAGDWNFAGGIRLDYENVQLNYDNYCSSSYTMYDNPAGTLPIPAGVAVFRKVPVELSLHGHLRTHYLQISPKVSVIRHLPGVNGSNVYVTIGKGFKAGGFNTQMFSDVLQQKLMEKMGIASQYSIEDIVSYKPEKSWNFEIGGHFNFLKSRLKADVSLFYINVTDQQLTVFPPGETTGRMMTNAGKTRSFGGEITLDYTPVPLLNVMVSYGYTNARFVKYKDGNMDYKGKRLPYAPSNTLFAQVTYLIPLSSKAPYYVELSANVSGVGDIYWNEANSLKQNLYALLGCSVAYKAPRWSLELWGKNLTDTGYATFYFKSMGNEFLQRGKPISVGATVRATF